MEAFQHGTHMERLALVRNPRVYDKLIEQIFDHEDQELGITLEARAELVKAFLTNDHAIRDSFKGQFDFIDGWSSYSTRSHFSQLWKLISKWPKGTGNLQDGVYRCIGASDETKAEIYQGCDVPVWRQPILLNCESHDTRTIGLGMQDQDERCRELAYSKVHLSQIHNKDVILQGQDVAALRGLGDNKALPVDFLQKVRGQLGRFGNELDTWLVGQTIQEVESKKPPPALGDKLDFIHEKLQSFEEGTKQGLEGIEKNIRNISLLLFNLVIPAAAVAATIFMIGPFIKWLSSIF